MNSTTRNTILSALAFLGGVALGATRRPPRNLGERLVLVTGGSRGLGYALVRDFAKRGAKVLFCARHGEEIAHTEAALRSQGLDVAGLVGDLTEQPRELAERVLREHGPLDILVNNAGVIQVAPLVVTGEQSFQESIDLFVYGPLRLSQAVLPTMISRGGGAIVNIASVGGQVIAPHMAAYNCGKAALVALSESMSVELDRFGIHVLTVVPGLMRTGSHRNAKFGGVPQIEYGWFSRMAVNPLFAASPSGTAAAIVDALLAGKRTLYSGWEAKLGPLFHNAFTELSLQMTSLVEKLLPTAGDPNFRTGESLARQGAQMDGLLETFEKASLATYQGARSNLPGPVRS